MKLLFNDFYQPQDPSKHNINAAIHKQSKLCEVASAKDA